MPRRAIDVVSVNPDHVDADLRQEPIFDDRIAVGLPAALIDIDPD